MAFSCLFAILFHYSMKTKGYQKASKRVRDGEKRACQAEEKAGILYQPNVSLKISICREKQVERLSVIQSEVSQKEKTK